MNERPDPVDPAAAASAMAAAQDLARVRDKVDAARAVLMRLLQEVVVAESRLGNNQAAQMLEANEQLVLAALRQQAEAQAVADALAAASRAADIDPLTQLPNRALLLDRFNQGIAQARRQGGRLALLFIDLDEFKPINDTHGHAAGDEVLRQVARRLAGAVRAVDTVSRHGGDEFLVLLSEVSHQADVALIAAKLLAVLAEPGLVGDAGVRLTASIGISLYPEDGQDPATLINRADAAMYLAKHQGAGSFVFHGEGQAGPAGGPAAAPRAQAQALAAHQRRNAQLQEANERLVVAALGAQTLHAAAERARLQQAELMAAVAEELGDPMAPIRLATAMLGRAAGDEPLLPRVKTIIEQQVAHMSRLLGAASDLSGLGGGAPGSVDVVSELGPVIADAVLDSRPAMDLRQQRLVVSVQPGPLAVRGDAQRLAQVLRNLLDNASKYSRDQGTVWLTAVADGAQVVLTVADDGIGITPMALPGLFEPFGHDSHALGFNGVGVGIGLPVVRVLVAALGGTVVAQSAGRGRGSRFVVTLPLVAAAPAPA